MDGHDRAGVTYHIVIREDADYNNLCIFRKKLSFAQMSPQQ